MMRAQSMVGVNDSVKREYLVKVHLERPRFDQLVEPVHQSSIHVLGILVDYVRGQELDIGWYLGRLHSDWVRHTPAFGHGTESLFSRLSTNSEECRVETIGAYSRAESATSPVCPSTTPLAPNLSARATPSSCEAT